MPILPPPKELLFFITAAAILLITPGPAVFYIVARSVEQGRRAGLVSACGMATGAFVQIVAAALGLSALLVSSATAYSAVKYAGAAYLIYLGARRLFGSNGADGPEFEASAIPLRRIYAQAVLVETLNPKSAIFFLAFLPQFVNPARGSVTVQLLALGLIFIAMGLASDSLYAITTGSAAGMLRRSRTFARAQRYVSGGVYMALGVTTAVTGSRHS